MVGIQLEVAGDFSCGHPQCRAGRIQPVGLHVVDKFLGDDVERNALPAVEAHAAPDAGRRLLQAARVDSGPAEIGRHQAEGDRIPVGQNQGLRQQFFGLVGNQRRHLAADAAACRGMMIAKRPDGRLDPGLVAARRIVVIELQDQIRLVMGRHNLFEIIDDKRIRRALEGGHENGIGPGRFCDDLGRFQNLGGIVPVKFIEQRRNRRDILPG